MHVPTIQQWAALEKLGAKSRTKKQSVHCPGAQHSAGDRNPSLSVWFDDGGWLAFNCHAGCSRDEILAAAGLTLADIGPEREKRPPPARTRSTTPPPPPGPRRPAVPNAAPIEELGQYVKACTDGLRRETPLAQHAVKFLEEHSGISRDQAIAVGLGVDPGGNGAKRPGFMGGIRSAAVIIPFHDADGVVRGCQARPLNPNGGRRWQTPAGEGWAQWGVFGLERGDPIVLTEGPTDALTVYGAGYAAVFLRGAKLMPDDRLRACLRDHVVLVHGDNDDAGRRFADRSRETLDGIAKRAAILSTPEGHNDLAEWYERTGDAATFKGQLASAIATALTQADPALPTAAPKQGDGTGTASDDIAGKLNRTRNFVRRFVAFTSEHQLHAIVLWIAHTHAFAVADCSPRLAIQSAEKQSGKTRLLEVLEFTTCQPRQVVNVSEAALFRSIAAAPLTILFDEVDAIFGAKARDREDLRAMLNAGYRRGATVDRCVGEGAKLEVKAFPVFCPVALAGIGQLPDTVQDRSIVIRLRRRRLDEPVEKLRRRSIEPEAAELRGDLTDVFNREHIIEALTDSAPDLPVGLPDRAEDVWEPLVAIADLAGGEWPARARGAATYLTFEDRSDDGSVTELLLADIRTALGDDENIASDELCRRLAAIEESPWATWRGKGIEPRLLARLLRNHDVKPRQIWFGDDDKNGKNVRGYRAIDFADVFARYLPVPGTTARPLGPLGPLPLLALGPSGPNALAVNPGTGPEVVQEIPQPEARTGGEHGD